ncbi:MAG TPA: N-6 DNA methylase, partial [Methanothrix sp.]|nr:N-6 DNA methylase [Methanothrix sp.]
MVRDSMKNPDYGFYIGTARKFFVEAKKPSVNLENDVRAAFQLRSYAWSAGLPISLLTDFEEFSIYDCRIEPSNYDSPRVGLLRHFTYDKYVDHWDEIAALFSREAVLGGSLERYIESKKKARGTITVDEAFLREIDSWREILAKNIHRNNPDLTVRELNSSVQNTIDRIVFLRICEDRGIERFGQLKDRLTGETTIYTRLIELFRQADEKYNSGLFHFKEESGRGEPDRLTPSLKIDDVVLSEMIEKLYPPESPYRFSVIPAEILGHVYEQFLGKVISLGEDGGVEVEYKPEVRKAGGVYYTPTYIVEYIVEKTVGKLLAGQTPTTVSELRILDPACGSGSFLIGAYQRLLDWHLEWYTSHLVPHLAAGKAESSREVQALLPPGGPAGAGAVGNAA